MKFIHFADSHIDGFKDQKLSELSFQSLQYVVDEAIKEQVDFVLCAGDLFNTALPRVDSLKRTISILQQLQRAHIPLYAIAGSHDFSAHGKTMLDILELTGLLVNVMKGDIDDKGCLTLTPIIDPKTNVAITGVIGKRGMLDAQLYSDIRVSNVDAPFKIFMFHTSLEELRPKELSLMKAESVSLLPPHFNYYAGGHVHIRKRFSNNSRSNVVYPGPTFPNSFSELESLEHGSFVLYDDSKQFENAYPYTHKKIVLKKVVSCTIDAQGKTPSQINHDALEHIEALHSQLQKAIVLLRLKGTMSSGKPSEVDIRSLVQECYKQGSFVVLTNSYKLQGELFEEQETSFQDAQDIQQETIQEHLGQIDFPFAHEQETITGLIEALALQRQDGETKTTFSQRVIETAKGLIEISSKEFNDTEKNNS